MTMLQWLFCCYCCCLAWFYYSMNIILIFDFFVVRDRQKKFAINKREISLPAIVELLNHVWLCVYVCASVCVCVVCGNWDALRTCSCCLFFFCLGFYFRCAKKKKNKTDKRTTGQKQRDKLSNLLPSSLPQLLASSCLPTIFYICLDLPHVAHVAFFW